MANSNRLQRLHCYLCDLPRTPWSILGDFSEAICRGCCNYEGGDRIEEVIEYARNLRKAWDHQLRVLKTQCLTSSGASVGSSPSPNSVNGVVDGNGIAYHPMAVGLPYPHVQQRYIKGQPEDDHHHLAQSTQQAQNENGGGRREHVNSSSTKENNNNHHHGDLGDHRRIQKPIPNDSKQDVLPPSVIGQPPYVGFSRQQQEYQELPILVRETLSLLNSFVPFNVRFKKDHNLIARVFAFEAATRSSGSSGATEHELKIFAEYPHGSGNVFQSASAVAKQMYSDCMKDLGRGLSSGFKYLEYEVHNTQSEWRLLGDLLPEQVRFFREPLDHDGYPVRVNDAQVVQFNIPVGGDGMMIHQHQAGPAGGGRRKRKAVDDTNGDIHPANSPVSRTPRKTYKEREDEQMQRHLWMQSQVDSLRLSMAHLTGQRSQLSMYRGGPPPPPPSALAIVRAPPPTQQASPLAQHAVVPNSKCHLRGVPQRQTNNTSPRGPPWGLPSSMAALISAAGSVDAQCNGQTPAADNVVYPARGPDASRTARSNKDSAQGKERLETTERTDKPSSDSPEKSHINNVTPNDQPSPDSTNKGPASSPGQLKCYICSDLLEDTHFVQCPAVGGHKFCFPCSKSSIKQQGAGNDVFCPSGKQCPLAGSNLPWAFMQSEIKTILATDNHPHVKKESATD